MREMDALCYERGIEFDPAEVRFELAGVAQGIVGQPAWDGRSLAQELYEQNLLPEPWERDAVEAA